MNTASEFAQSNQTVAKHMTAGVDGFKPVFLDAVMRSQAEGGIAKRKNPELLATIPCNPM